MAILTLTIPGVGDYDYDTSTTGIPGQRQDLRAIQSFNILANDAGDEWTLYVNTQIFIGRYATQAQAIGALFGCFIRAGADEVGLAAAMGNQINGGLSVITDDGDNILRQEMADGRFEGRLRNFSEQSFVGTTTKPNFGTNSLSINSTPTIIAAGSQNLTVTARAEYGSSNTFFINTKVTATLNAIVLTPIVVPALSVNVSLPTAVPVVGQPYTASAALTNYDSRIPVKYKWTWLTGSSTVVQGPTTTSSPTNTYTPLLDNTAYKAKVEMLYEYDSTDISGATDQETSSPSETTFAWTTSFPITNSGSTYTVAPVVGTNYVGSNVTLAYSWFKDGAAFGTNSASQVLTVAGTYTCDVAGSNVINGITYSGTMAASNSAIVVPSTNPLMAVSSEGWDTSLTMPGTITSGANPNFDFTKSAITVQRAGFTSAGVADTKTLTHSLTNTVRLAYPNQADKDTVNGSGTYTARTSMSDSIYSTDTVSATSTANFDSTGDAYTFDVTNNSTLGTANVIANWVTPIADFEHTDTLSIDLMAFHASATGGDMGIACVKFFAYKNGSATASYTSTVTTPTTTTASRTGIKYPVFRFTQDISSDAAGDSYRIKAEVYPVWGAMFSSEGDETATYDITSKKRIINTNHFYDCLRWKETNDGTIPIMYVANAGSDATGNGTSANPYATIKRAKEQIFTNTSGYGGIIHVSGALGETAVALTTAWASLGSAPTWPTKIKGDGTAILYSGVSTDGDKNIKGAPYLIIDNVTFDYANVSGTLTGTGPATGGWYTFWGNGNSSENTAPTRLMFNNCVFKNMTTTFTNPYTTVYIDAVDHFACVQDVTCTTDHFFNGSVRLTGVRRNSGILVGNRLNGARVSLHPNVYVGNAGAVTITLRATNDDAGVWLTSNLERHRNNVIGAYNLIYNEYGGLPSLQVTGGSSIYVAGGWYSAGNDIAVVCNYSEALTDPSTGVNTAALYYISADGDTSTINNCLIWHNTAFNNRINYIYNDTAYALKSDINIRGNLFGASYIKADLFAGGDGTRVGNWATLNGVNAKYNCSPWLLGPGAGTGFQPDQTNDWYTDTDNNPLVLTSTPAMATRSRWDDPIGCVAGFESVVGFTYGAAESPIPILTDGTAATKLGAGVPSVVAPSAQDYTDYMATDAGVGYWEVSASTSGTGAVNGPTEGDASTTWTQIVAKSNPAGTLTTQSGTPVPTPLGEWNRNIIGGYNQLSNTYDYMAVSFGTSAGGYSNANAPGWVILEREAVAGTASGSRQTYLCIEGSDVMTEPVYAGGMPSWSGAGNQDSMVFFFNGYQAGDVKTWTDWDGTTTPDTYADWDSFASTGRFRVDMNSATNVEVLTAETTYGNPSGGEIGSSATADFLIYTTDAPAFAVWSVVNSTWVVSTRNPAADAGRLAYGDGSNQFVVNDFYYIVPLTTATPPVNPSTWRAYDGPAIRDYDEYMAANAGVGYWEIPFGQGTTAFPGPRTGGDASTTWIDGMTVPTYSGSATTKSGIVLPNITRRLSGPYLAQSNPYQYCAVAWQEAATGQWNGTQAPGWVICEVEAVVGTVAPPHQTYLPIEGTSGMISSPYTPGQMPPWSYSSTNNLDMLVFFFDGYQAGDVDTWTVWDGATNPTTYEDWDTYHSGFVEYNPAFNNNPVGSNHVLQGDITWRNSVSSYVSNTTIQQQYFASADGGQWYPPAIAQWYPNANGGVGEWRVGEYVSHSSHTTSTTVVYDIASSPNQEVYTIYLDTVPVTLPSTWRAYDGPVPADFSSPKFYPVATAGIAGNLAGFSSNQYNNTQLFDNLGMVQINTSIATNAITFFFHTALARDEFKAFTDFTFGGTSFNPSADADWVELNAGSNGFGLKYTDSAVCAAWTASMTSRSNTGNVTGSYIGTSTFATPAQTMTWTLDGTPGTLWPNSGTAVVSAVTGTEFLRPQSSPVDNGPRLLNGAEANNFGAISYAFQNYPSGTHLSNKAQCTWYWQSLDVRTSNSRLGTTIQRAPAFTEVQATYNNTSAGYGQGNIVSGPDFNGWEGGDVVNFEIRDNNYASKRLRSFTNTGNYTALPCVSIGGSPLWNNTVLTYSTQRHVNVMFTDIGKRDGVYQWITETGATFEFWDRDTNTAYPVNAVSIPGDTTTKTLYFQHLGYDLVVGNRYELRYV